MLTLYDIVYGVASPGVVPYFLIRYALKRKSVAPLRGMLGGDLGQYGKVRDEIKDVPVAWFHAVSMGEVNVTRAVIGEFQTQMPDFEVILSTITETGQHNARRHFADSTRLIFYHPIDLSPVVTKFLDTLRPTAYIMMETELWPNMLVKAKEKGVKIFLVNGRMSDESFRWYKMAKALLRRPLESIHAFAMQTEEDAEKIRELLPNAQNVFVTGNCKFDIEPPALSEKEQRDILEHCKFKHCSDIIVVGSSHKGEEVLMVELLKGLKQTHPHVRMIIAPRHPNRFESVYSLLKESGLRVGRFSSPDTEDPEVVVLNEMGKLAKIYGVGKLAIACGSFVPIGGHNILEPAAHKIPVLYGPHMHNQKVMTKMLNRSGGGVQVDAASLTETVLHLLDDNEARKKAGDAAYRTAMQNRGSTKKTIEILRNYL